MNVLDVRGVGALLEGRVSFTIRLAGESRWSACVPREVLRHFRCALEALPESPFRSEMARRLDRIARDVLVAEETDTFNKAFVRLRVARPEDDVLDTVAAAHAVALGGAVLTSGAGPFAAMAGVEVKDWA